MTFCMRHLQDYSNRVIDHRPLSLSWLLLILVICNHPLFAQRDLKGIPSPDPRLEQETFVVAAGF